MEAFAIRPFPSSRPQPPGAAADTHGMPNAERITRPIEYQREETTMTTDDINLADLETYARDAGGDSKDFAKIKVVPVSADVLLALVRRVRQLEEWHYNGNAVPRPAPTES